MTHRLRTWHHWAILWGVLALLLTPLRAQDIPNPFPPGEITVLPALSNGIHLVLQENHASPVISMEVVIRNGSAANLFNRGAAHFFEHASFRATEAYPEIGAAQRVLELAGGQSNAVTTRDAIRYSATVPSTEAPLLFRVLSEVTQHALLTDAVCEAQRPVILDEIARSADDPISTLIDRAFQVSYPGDPYRNATKGSVDEVTNLPPAAVREFAARWATPHNMSVVVVGDITPAETTRLAQVTFGTTKRTETSPLADDIATSLSSQPADHIPSPSQDTFQVMAFAAPAATDFQAEVAMDLLAVLLAEGSSRELPNCWASAGLQVMRYGVEYIPSKGPGRLLIWTQSAPASVNGIRQATAALLARLAGMQIPTGMLQDARQRLIVRFLQENETFTQRADTLGKFEAIFGAGYASRYVPTVQRLTPNDIRAVVPTSLLAAVTLGHEPKGL